MKTNVINRDGRLWGGEELRIVGEFAGGEGTDRETTMETFAGAGVLEDEAIDERAEGKVLKGIRALRDGDALTSQDLVRKHLDGRVVVVLEEGEFPKGLSLGVGESSITHKAVVFCVVFLAFLLFLVALLVSLFGFFLLLDLVERSLS